MGLSVGVFKDDGMLNLRARAESVEFGLGKDAFKIDKQKPEKKNEIVIR